MIAWQCLLVLSVWDAAAKGLSSPVLRTGEGHSGVGDDRPPVTGSFIYSPKTKAWREGPALRTPRVETASFTANGRIYQFGGSTKSLGGETIDSVVSIGPGETQWRDEGKLQNHHASVVYDVGLG